MPKLVQLKWVDQNGTTICTGAQEVEVSQKSYELNLKVHEKSQFPKYIKPKDVVRYFDEKVEKTVEAEKPAPKPKAEKPVKAETPETEIAKSEKPIFKTKEEKDMWEKAQAESDQD
jgi:hypothetical protein